MAGITNILCLAVLAGVFISANAVDYCKLSCNGITHTMCKYQSPAPGPACKQAHSQGLTIAEKNSILKKHNELRRKVASGKEPRGNPGPQPPAANMPDLTWDNELETIAQRLASQCVFQHDQCRNVERFSVGQNIAIYWASGQDTSNVEDMTQGWYEEVQHFNNRDVSSFKFSMKTAHYTQMMWADTTKLGCGRMKYKDLKGMDTHLLVCNYGPTGNWEGAMIYKRK